MLVCVGIQGHVRIGVYVWYHGVSLSVCVRGGSVVRTGDEWVGAVFELHDDAVQLGQHGLNIQQVQNHPLVRPQRLSARHQTEGDNAKSSK